MTWDLRCWSHSELVSNKLRFSSRGTTGWMIYLWASYRWPRNGATGHGIQLSSGLIGVSFPPAIFLSSLILSVTSYRTASFHIVPLVICEMRSRVDVLAISRHRSVLSFRQWDSDFFFWRVLWQDVFSPPETVLLLFAPKSSNTFLKALRANLMYHIDPHIDQHPPFDQSHISAGKRDSVIRDLCKWSDLIGP